ncbi:lipase family protein [Photobacterium profundum]|nr:lipase family protein [Photobacterium profundum]
MATVAAKRLPATYKIAACYSFGAPRVGDIEGYRPSRRLSTEL